VAVLALATLSIALVWWLQARPLSDYARLAAHPEAQLHYPGSVLLYDGGIETTREATAQRWQLLGTTATREEILAFYVGELTARGYVNGGSYGRTSIESTACAWTRDDLSVRIGFSEPAEIRRRFKIDPAYTTVYDLRIIDGPGNLHARPCASLTECEFIAAPGSGAGPGAPVRCRFLDGS
jgi:hypothetical protein